MSKSTFGRCTPAVFERRRDIAAKMLEEFPKNLHREMTEMLQHRLTWAEPNWRTLIDIAEEAEEERHKKAKLKLKVISDKHRKECKHENTHYDPDPSGNHDSTTECLDCGKIL